MLIKYTVVFLCLICFSFSMQTMIGHTYRAVATMDLGDLDMTEHMNFVQLSTKNKVKSLVYGKNAIDTGLKISKITIQEFVKDLNETKIIFKTPNSTTPSKKSDFLNKKAKNINYEFVFPIVLTFILVLIFMKYIQKQEMSK